MKHSTTLGRSSLMFATLASLVILQGCAASGLGIPDPVTQPGASVAFAETPSCAEVRASCGAATAMFVRGHAENLNALDGAHVRFAIRYLLSSGDGLDVPHGVVTAASVVRAGAFEACVCVPMNAGSYPQVAAVVFQPNSTTETPSTVARATFSQRYATLGDEDVGYGLNAVPTAVGVTATLAALEDRVATLTIADGRTLSGTDRVIAGIVSPERPLAALAAAGVLDGNDIRFRWIMPGRVLPNERVAFVIDRNHNGHCDDADAGGVATVGANSTLNAASLTLLTGAALTPICDALAVGTPRG